MTTRIHSRIAASFALGLLATTLGCGKASRLSAGSTTQIVCDPFLSSAQTLDSQRGVAGAVYTFSSPQMYQYNNVLDLQRYGTRLDAVVFMGALDLLPNRFTDGFPVSGGGRLLNPDGSALTEFFSLHLESTVELSPTDAPGDYQFALLSDDGSLLRIKESSYETTLIANDGAHAPWLICASRAVTFSSNTRLPVKLDYFQGPRDQLAVSLLWRKVENSAPATLADAACNQGGPDYFYTFPAAPAAPAPTAEWNSFISRGWAPLKAANFVLPAGVGSNPCF